MVVLLILKASPFKVLVAPRSNRLENRTHGLSVTRDAVFNPWRDLGISCAADQPLVFQIAKRRGQDFMGNLRHETAEFVESACA